jgi:hypothetical protein
MPLLWRGSPRRVFDAALSRREQGPVARGFIPAGARSGPKAVNSIFLAHRVAWFWGLLRSPAGINPLATKGVFLPT